MCGIVGVVGTGTEVDTLLDGLARLEYRGYDSAGLTLVVDGGLWRARAANGTRSLDDLRKLTESAPKGASAGIGHTRWATHGQPTEQNAHPHHDCTGRVAVVHNGIIENHLELARELRGAGHVLASSTDTEVLAHLVEAQLAAGLDLAAAVRSAIGRLRGSFAIAVVYAGSPDLVVAARRGSPLILGRSAQGASLLASDMPALLGRATEFFVVGEGQMAELGPVSFRVTDTDGTEVLLEPEQVTWDLEAAQKGGFDDFMSKEIFEQPKAVADTLLGRVGSGGELLLDEPDVKSLGAEDLRRVDKVFIVACGTSYHAGMVAKYAIERWVRIPVEIDIASEFRYRDPVLDDRTLVVAVSQSGETTDTLEALKAARGEGATVVAVCNVVHSSMAREADGVLYTHAGPEIGVAATKTHLSQMVALQLLALTLAQVRGTLSASEIGALLAELHRLPEKVSVVLERVGDVEAVARRFTTASSFFFLGRHVGYPVALEGALKLKEISYLRAEGYPAGELKHGPIALIEPGSVVVAVATRTDMWEKMMANVAEVQSRGATTILVANDGDTETASLADAVLWVPSTEKLLAPVLDVVPLQLFAYWLARLSGNDVDRPRNLAKTVTVE